ncbi:hypothetical protein E2C01_004946 [Portunus trituberculatus]|uniref:Uncharacterized protein n=1 Tax=Portunus trituberculatus TaxID=210409 RepID=A0A5B7CUB9_PORTR|nr:hypothetical protein [Portunus trituberculatus]
MFLLLSCPALVICKSSIYIKLYLVVQRVLATPAGQETRCLIGRLFHFSQWSIDC